jgi:hypothetical protein
VPEAFGICHRAYGNTATGEAVRTEAGRLDAPLLLNAEAGYEMALKYDRCMCLSAFLMIDALWIQKPCK